MVIDPRRIADCGMWPYEMTSPEARALLEALQRLDAQRIPIEVDTIHAELLRCGHDARAILRRLRLTLYAIDSASSTLAGYTWTYDSANRLTVLTVYGHSAEDATYTHDDTNQLTGADRS